MYCRNGEFPATDSKFATAAGAAGDGAGSGAV